MLQIKPEPQLNNQLKSNQDGKLFAQPLTHQTAHQSNQKVSTREKKSISIKPSPSTSSSRLQSSLTSQAQPPWKPRPMTCHSNPQHQRLLKPGSQRSLSSNVKIARKPELDHSPFQGRRSFSSSSSRSNWDERFNALSQSLKDICGSPKQSSSFTRSVTVPGQMQTNKERKNAKLPSEDSLAVPQMQTHTRPKRSPDPYVRLRGMPRESQPGGKSLLSKHQPLATSTPKSKGNKNGVTFENPTQPIIIKDTDYMLQLTEELNNFENNLPSSPVKQHDFDKTSTTNHVMIASCPEGLTRDLCHPEGQTSSYNVEEHPQPNLRQLQIITKRPPTSPRYSCSLPGSNFSSPGSTLAKSSGLLKPKSCMRRINSVFLETIPQQPIFIVDPCFKKITVRHEESSKSLELELTRVLFNNLNQPSQNEFTKGDVTADNSKDIEMTSIAYPIRSEFLYKVAIKPYMVALEELYVELIGERKLQIGKMKRTFREIDENILSVDAEREKTQATSSLILDEVVIPNEVFNWTCSMSEDRRWLSIKEVLHSATIDAGQTTSLSNSQSSIPLLFVDCSTKSARLDLRQNVVPVVEFSSNCSARYQPIVACHLNSSRLSIVTRVPEEFDQEDLIIRRLDQQVIIKGKKKMVQNGSSYLLNVQFSTQASNDLPVDNNDINFRECPQKSVTTETTPTSAASEVVATEESKENPLILEDATSWCFQTPLLKSSSIQMGESSPYFSITIPLPPTALGRTVGAYMTPLKNLVIYAALNISKRRRRSF